MKSWVRILPPRSLEARTLFWISDDAWRSPVLLEALSGVASLITLVLIKSLFVVLQEGFGINIIALIKR